MEPRPIIDLYRVVLNTYAGDKYPWICNSIEFSKCMTFEERSNLLFHFKLQKPSKHHYSEFFEDSRFKRYCSEWWDRNEIQVRIDFLKAIIKKLEENLVEPK